MSCYSEVFFTSCPHTQVTGSGMGPELRGNETLGEIANSLLAKTHFLSFPGSPQNEDVKFRITAAICDHGEDSGTVGGGLGKHRVAPEDKANNTEGRVRDGELKVLVTIVGPRIKPYLQPDQSWIF